MPSKSKSTTSNPKSAKEAGKPTTKINRASATQPRIQRGVKRKS